MQVLVIEPDRIIRHTYRAALADAGHAVTEAANAQEAVQAADAQTPEVILLDIDMAKHNGIEFLYELKSYPEWHHIPVILLVSRSQYELSKHAVLRQQLSVKHVFVKSQLSLALLCEAVAAMTSQPAT